MNDFDTTFWLEFHGEDGWHPNIPMAGNVAQRSRRIDDFDMDDNDNSGGGRFRVTPSSLVQILPCRSFWTI
jgi:hypothetical protein